MEAQRGKLLRALDLIDEAIDLLRDAARADKALAELLEDVLYNLEEAGETLNSILEGKHSL